ncbi:MAG TPA: hypothetical protein VIL09_18105 [Microvirga sp.]|jgi:hypothetical protein
MRRLVWIFGWIAIALWSLVAWISYGLLDVVGGFATRNADRVIDYPEGVEFLGWALSALQGLGGFAIVAVWALVSLAILAATAVAARVLGAVAGSSRHGGGAYRSFDPNRGREAYPPMDPRRGSGGGGLPSAVREVMRRIDRR